MLVKITDFIRVLGKKDIGGSEEMDSGVQSRASGCASTLGGPSRICKHMQYTEAVWRYTHAGLFGCCLGMNFLKLNVGLEKYLPTVQIFWMHTHQRLTPHQACDDSKVFLTVTLCDFTAALVLNIQHVYFALCLMSRHAVPISCLKYTHKKKLNNP